ncbi:MAG: hypothetical protein ACJAZ3_000720 [Sphingobacteriales bacterium]|jgi:hypothetical protein
MKKINCLLLVDDNSADNFLHKLIIEEAGTCNNIHTALTSKEGLDYLHDR